jgi:3-deoxy-D-manno-octulosonate 8-phosphate phosphatase (KDO 8-P phosphatase)
MAGGKKLAKRVKRIKMILFDVDGVMTDGGIYYSADGLELKRFNVQDGYGVARAREQGLKIGMVSGRSTPIVETRAKELNVEDLFQDVADKLVVVPEIQKRHGLNEEEIAFMGDDLFDLPLLRAVGFSAAPSNARSKVRKAVDYVTEAEGGNGAVRELIDFILKHQLG